MQFDFGKNQVVDNLETVPESFRGLYKEHEGKFKIDSEHAGVKSAVAAIVGLNTALLAARNDIDALKKKKDVDLSPLKEYGESVEDILSAVSTRITEAAKGKDKDLEQHLKRQKEELQRAHQAELDKHTKETQALTGQLHKMLVGNQALTALTEANAIDAELVLPHLTNQVKVERSDDGELRVFVHENGQVRYSSTGGPMTIKELVNEMKSKDKYKPLFKSEAPKGGGKPAGTRGVTAPAGGRELSSVEKISAGLTKNQHVRG